MNKNDSSENKVTNKNDNSTRKLIIKILVILVVATTVYYEVTHTIKDNILGTS